MQFVLAVISDTYIGWNDILYIKRYWQHSEECMGGLRNIAMRDYQESVTTGQTRTRTDGQTPDKVIPMRRFALQATQQNKLNII